MTGRWTEASAAVASPALALSAHTLAAAPLPLTVVVALTWPLVYIYRQTVIWVLGWKALGTTSKDNRVAEVMSTITGVPLQPVQTQPAADEDTERDEPAPDAHAGRRRAAHPRLFGWLCGQR